jgi:hypothetical protein
LAGACPHGRSARAVVLALPVPGTCVRVKPVSRRRAGCIGGIQTERRRGVFPFGLGGSVLVPSEDSTDAVAKRLVRALEAACATQLTRDGDTIAFRVRLLRPVRSWNILTPIDRGRLSLSRTDGRSGAKPSCVASRQAIIGLRGSLEA